MKLDEHGQPTDTPLDGFDPRYASVDFSLQGRAARAISTASPIRSARRRPVATTRDQLSRQGLSRVSGSSSLDRLALIMPDWRERHVPDIGIMLVELSRLCRRSAQLLPGCGGDRSLSRYGPPADLGAPSRAAGRLHHARRLQCARLGDAREREGHFRRCQGQVFFCTAFPGAPESARAEAGGRCASRAGTSSFECFSPLLADDVTQIEHRRSAQRNPLLQRGAIANAACRKAPRRDAGRSMGSSPHAATGQSTD